MEAVNKIKLYFHLKKQSPEVFRYRNPYSEEMRRCFENQNYCVLPVTPQGYQVYLGCLRDTHVSTFVFNSIAKAQYMSIGESMSSYLCLSFEGDTPHHHRSVCIV